MQPVSCVNSPLENSKGEFLRVEVDLVAFGSHIRRRLKRTLRQFQHAFEVCVQKVSRVKAFPKRRHGP